MPYMIYREIVRTGSALLVLSLDERRYELRYDDTVIYRNGVRIVRGRTFPYQFRSVEQLRYDFERDVIACGGDLGEAA